MLKDSSQLVTVTSITLLAIGTAASASALSVESGPDVPADYMSVHRNSVYDESYSGFFDHDARYGEERLSLDWDFAVNSGNREKARLLYEFASKLGDSNEDLDPDIARTVRENFWDLL